MSWATCLRASCWADIRAEGSAKSTRTDSSGKEEGNSLELAEAEAGSAGFGEVKMAIDGVVQGEQAKKETWMGLWKPTQSS